MCGEEPLPKRGRALAFQQSLLQESFKVDSEFLARHERDSASTLTRGNTKGSGGERTLTGRTAIAAGSAGGDQTGARVWVGKEATKASSTKRRGARRVTTDDGSLMRPITPSVNEAQPLIDGGAAGYSGTGKASPEHRGTGF